MDLVELTDRAEISDLLSAYCNCVDTSDVDALLGLFTPSSVIDMGQGAVFSGFGQLRPLFIERIGMYESTNHYWSNLQVAHLDAGSASVVSSLYVFHDAPARQLVMHLWGRYEDELVKDAGSWKFLTRRLRVDGDHGGAVLGEQVADRLANSACRTGHQGNPVALLQYWCLTLIDDRHRRSLATVARSMMLRVSAELGRVPKD